MATVRKENLAAYMKRDRGSTVKIAKALGIKTSTVSQWKSGTRPVPAEHVPIICEILHITEDDLCQPFHPFQTDLEASEEGRMLLKIWPHLTDDDRGKVLLMALQLRQFEQADDSGA